MIPDRQFLYQCILMVHRSKRISDHECVMRLFNLGFRGPALTGLNWRISLAKD